MKSTRSLHTLFNQQSRCLTTRCSRPRLTNFNKSNVSNFSFPFNAVSRHHNRKLQNKRYFSIKSDETNNKNIVNNSNNIDQQQREKQQENQQEKQQHINNQNQQQEQQQHSYRTMLADEVQKLLHTRFGKLKSDVRKAVGLAILATLVGIGGTIFIFRSSLSQLLSNQTSEVAAKTLEDEVVLKKAEELSKVVLAKVLDDRGTMAMSQDFINRLAQSDTSKKLLQQVLNDPANQAVINEFAQQVAWRVLVDERTSLLCGELAVKVMARDDVRAAATRLAAAVVRNDETRAAASDLARSVLASQQVKDTASNAIHDATLSAFTPRFLRRSNHTPPVGHDTPTTDPNTTITTTTDTTAEPLKN